MALPRLRPIAIDGWARLSVIAVTVGTTLSSGSAGAAVATAAAGGARDVVAISTEPRRARASAASP